ncbi:MAG: glycosyltransferase [Chloroflexi bacterium]|nr:glycosyltransferase [Chloroflexota bacterium]
MPQTARVPPAPVKLFQVELADPLPDVCLLRSHTRGVYTQARALVRLHGCPLGLVELHPAAPGDVRLSAGDLAQTIWHALHTEVNAHLGEDGLSPITQLGVRGLRPTSVAERPRCQQERHDFLTRAPFVSVVVPTRERPGQVGACLRSLLTQTYPRFEIIVVENGPVTTATTDAIATLAHREPRIRHVREERASVSRARNRGLREAHGSIVAFSDDDVVHDPDWLGEMVRGFEAAPNVACVTGAILPAALETPPQIWLEQYGGFTKGFARPIFDLREHRPPGLIHPYAAGSFGSGASSAFRADILLALGGFDEALGPPTAARGGEDLAAFFEVIANRHPLVYRPTAITYHAHRPDYPGLRDQIYGYGVGLTAYLTKCALDHPWRLLDMMLRLPFGLTHLLSPRSAKNQKKSANYPSELTYIELQGMIRGPFAFLRGRFSAARSSHSEGPQCSRHPNPFQS